MNISFCNEQSIHKADEIVNYLTGPRLWIPQADYPDYDDWIQKVHFQLKKEEKRALIALYNNKVVGAIIYQRHLEQSDALEIKNITVRPDMQGRYIASFLLRNSEIEGMHDFKIEKVLIDAKVKNLEIRSFLFKNNYLPVKIANLYQLNMDEDVIYEKELKCIKKL